MALFQPFLCLSRAPRCTGHVFCICSLADACLRRLRVLAFMSSAAWTLGCERVSSQIRICPCPPPGVGLLAVWWSHFQFFVEHLYFLHSDCTSFHSRQRCRRAPAFCWRVLPYTRGSPGIASGKEPACQRRGHKWCGFSPWVGGSPGEGDGDSLQFSCLETPMDRGARWATVLRGQDWSDWAWLAPIRSCCPSR